MPLDPAVDPRKAVTSITEAIKFLLDQAKLHADPSVASRADSYKEDIEGVEAELFGTDEPESQETPQTQESGKPDAVTEGE